jgi:elongation of very long chain fatty acids protein 4
MGRGDGSTGRRKAEDAPAGSAEPTGLVELCFTAALAAAYSVAQLRAATPAGGLGAATAHFYASTTSYELPAAATVVYLTFCWLGPRLMAGRPAFGCKAAMLVYNAYQALFNAVCVALFVREVRRNGLAVWANVLPQPWDDQPRFGLIALGIWLHYNNKARPPSFPGASCSR